MRKVFVILVIATAISLSNSCSSDSLKPVNPKASKEAKALFNFLTEIKGKYILSGQHDFINGGTRYSDSVKVITGKFPVVWGSDFSW